MAEIRNIIFDLGGVLIDWNPRYLFKDIFESEEKLEWFLNNICTMEWNVQQDAGRSLADGTQLLQEKHPEWHHEIDMYYSQWDKMLGGPIQHSVQIFERLREQNRHNVFALTNWSSETFPIARQRYSFLEWFQDILVSGEHGCIKPDHKIYNLAVDRFNISKSDTLFIDDNKHNVTGALSFGMPALLFTSPEALENELLEREILM